MTNASDNADIEKTDAEKQQIQINTILSLANVLDDETIVQSICEILDISYEDVKGKITLDEEKDTLQAITELKRAVINE